MTRTLALLLALAATPALAQSVTPTSASGVSPAAVTIPASGTAPPAGTTQLTGRFTDIVGAAGNPVQMPIGSASGDPITIANSSAVPFSVYPPAGGVIGTSAANVPLVVSPNTVATLYPLGPLMWKGGSTTFATILSAPPRPVATATDTIAFSDNGNVIVDNSASATTETMPTLALGFSTRIFNAGTGTVQLTNGTGEQIMFRTGGGILATSSVVAGNAALYLLPGISATITQVTASLAFAVESLVPTQCASPGSATSSAGTIAPTSNNCRGSVALPAGTASATITFPAYPSLVTPMCVVSDSVSGFDAAGVASNSTTLPVTLSTGALNSAANTLVYICQP